MAVNNRELQDIIALDISANARLVLLEILSHRRGYTVHRANILKRVGISENTLDGAIKELRPFGLLEKQKRGSNGKYSPGYRAATGPQKLGNGTGPQKLGSLIGKIGTVAPKAEINRTADTLMKLWTAAGSDPVLNTVRQHLRGASRLAGLPDIERRARQYIAAVIASGRSPCNLAKWLRDERFVEVTEDLRVIEGGRSEVVPPALQEEPGLSPRNRCSEKC
ncbi:hypothetical protein [Thalassococcus lentus]|uniref:Helix-turn-helix domain-containing protein n=1 Tax=Thalassococcus lentus TaxID=1210524 RepID=A0ABT4XPE1_9RHOB|nr:hypothetical protein [Thalassococcus lentus]MDA7423819.1 hypothetical protein [Thalassococcus lentus]